MDKLLNTNNQEILQSIKKEKSADFWDELTSEQQSEIINATTEIENGDSSDYNSFMTEHQ